MRLENTWQEIRDNSFIQNHSRPFRFPAPWRCFFSSVHLAHVLQGSGQRTGMAITEALFCARWTICVLFLRFVFGQLYGPNMAHYKISNRISHLLIFYLLVFDRIHDVSKQDVQDLQQKYRPTKSKIKQYISLYTWGTFYPCVHQTHLECYTAKKVILIWP